MVVEILQDEVEGFQVFFDVGACEVKRTDEVLCILVVHFIQNTAPFCGEALDTLHTLGLDHFNELLSELLLALVMLSPYTGQLAHNNRLVLWTFIQQQRQFFLKSNLLRRRGFLEELPVDNLRELLEQLWLEVVNLDGFIDFFNEAVLKVWIFVNDASIKHNAVLEGYIFADVAIFADDAFVDTWIVLDFAVLANVDVVGKISAVCDFGASSYEFVELADSEDFVLRGFLKLNESLIIVHRIGIQIPAYKVHIG